MKGQDQAANVGALHMYVTRAEQGDLESWQAFVDGSPDAGAMHHAGWFGVLRDAYAVDPYFFIARDGDGCIRGVMPGYLSNSLIIGKHYTTLDGAALLQTSNAGRNLEQGRQRP